MLKLELFRAATSRSATSRRFTMYAGLAILFFFLVIYLQEVAGYTRPQERARRRCR